MVISGFFAMKKELFEKWPKNNPLHGRSVRLMETNFFLILAL